MTMTNTPIPSRDPSSHSATEQPTTKKARLLKTSTPNPTTPFRVLTLDGGGIRGLLSARILESIERQTGARFYDHVDFFAGTSSGSILAGCLACGYTIDECVQLYKESAPKIFADSLADNLKDLGMLLGAQYDIGPFRDVLFSIFGHRKLGDLKKRFLAVVFDLKSDAPPYCWRPKVFHNFPGKDSDADELLADVVLRSCALPTNFPSYQGYIDGGVCGALNPVMCAVAQALDGRNELPTKLEISDLLVLSIGTGRVPKYIDGSTLDWGQAKWAPHFVDLIQDAAVDMADFECAQILGERYHRVQVDLPRKVEPDDPAAIPFLDEIARSPEVTLLCDQAATWVTRTGFLGAPS